MTLDALGAQADVIITITSACSPSLMNAQGRPGAHLACRGTDTVGNQEVESAMRLALERGVAIGVDV